MKRLIAVIAVLLVFAGISCRQSVTSNNTSENGTSPSNVIDINTTQPEMVGKIAPDIHLNDLKGNPVSLSDFHGKPVLLIFWATWSTESRQEMPVIQEIYNNWQSKGLAVLAVDILNSRPEETEEAVAGYVRDNNFTFPVLLDSVQMATIQYHIGGPPTNILIDKDGFIREITAGPFLSQAAVETSIRRILPQ